MELSSGAKVRHERLGIGTVKYDDGETVGIRFENGIEECARADIQPLLSFQDSLLQEQLPPPLEVVTRIQAEAIQSINDTWGIFSLSRIDLLPHQLWVCKRVTERLPTRWLIADDVGLGKTIEAGLILWPLISRNQFQRVLILCPASLVSQWQTRLLKMFDLRFMPYIPELDTQQSDYWNAPLLQVIASIQTLRKDSNGRHNRLLKSHPWDLVIVDEAHHMNADEHSGYTLGYKLIEKLEENSRIRSMIFFSGTPHRGKNFGFLALLRLLRGDIFSPEKALSEQLDQLSQVVIRNNKQNVTDLKGERLFHAPLVRSQPYNYSPEESAFYEMLTAFILGGKAYASSLDQKKGKAVMLVLISMQKLASSSVAAIRRALKNRLKKTIQDQEDFKENIENIVKQYRDAQEDETEDVTADMEEKIAEYRDKQVMLMKDEEDRLSELIQKADAVKEETKIKKIIELVEEDYRDRTILFFTEYKATQSLLMSALMERFRKECVTFINGEDTAKGVITPDGVSVTLYEKRETAADRFNSGDVRFLVSTEAAGEGIDLQENCHTLIHVDLPWNPMRMHQRVGRLNRYLQKHRVEVVSLWNPNTVESLIWQKLDGKIREIMTTFGSVMEEPEDLMKLVLGLTDSGFINELYSESLHKPKKQLSEWFDQKTQQFAGKDAIETVKAIVGNSDKFDYQQVSSQLPDMDLANLKPFFKTMLRINNRQIEESAETGSLSFITPEKWKGKIGVMDRYTDIVFTRKSKKKASQIIGIGNKLMNSAIEQAKNHLGEVALLPAQILPKPLIAFKLIDRITDQDINVRKKIFGVQFDRDTQQYEILKDSDILSILNQIPYKRYSVQVFDMINMTSAIKGVVESAEGFLLESITDLDLPFRFPKAEFMALLWPEPDSAAIREYLEDREKSKEKRDITQTINNICEESEIPLDPLINAASRKILSESEW